MNRTLATLGVVAVAGAIFATSVAVRSHDRASGASPAKIDRSAAAVIKRAEKTLRDHPDDPNAYALIAMSALGRVKETADSGWYLRSQQASQRALAIDPNNVPALDATAILANARHRFRDAIAPATKSLRLAPDRFGPLEILTDAHVELGHYRTAFRLAARRLALRPDLASYSRASYAAELQGDRALATELMGLAADASRAGSPDRAWARTHVGLLRLGSGRLAAAEQEMRRAIAEGPGDSTALAGLAKVTAAQGDLDGAADLYRQSLQTAQVASVAAELAEIEELRGHSAASTAALALSHELDRREAVNGVRLDLDAAHTDADFRIPNAADIARARRGHHDRPGVVGDDALGWVLTRSGHCAEGFRYARRSLRLGTRDALMMFHAAMAARCSGRTVEARRLIRATIALNPRFSPRWSPVARTIARQLGER